MSDGLAKVLATLFLMAGLGTLVVVMRATVKPPSDQELGDARTKFGANSKRERWLGAIDLVHDVLADAGCAPPRRSPTVSGLQLVLKRVALPVTAPRSQLTDSR